MMIKMTLMQHLLTLLQLQCNIYEQTSLMVVITVNFINDNINVNAING